MSEEYSIVKVPQGKCENCGEEHGILVIVGTGEFVDNYDDCQCYDNILYEELNNEETAQSLYGII